MVPGPDRAAVTALVGWRAVGPEYATPARTSMGASVSVSGRSCVRFGGYGAARQPKACRHRQQDGPQVAREMRRAWRKSHSLRSGRRRSRIQASLKPRRDRRTSSPTCRDRRLQRTTHHGSAGTTRPEAR